MKASATLFYGLTVRGCDLVAATRAHAQVKPALQSLGLISLRQRRGTLRMTEHCTGALERVPWEVWQMVRSEVIKDAVAEARVGLVGDSDCPEEEDGEIDVWRSNGIDCKQQDCDHTKSGVDFVWRAELKPKVSWALG